MKHEKKSIQDQTRHSPQITYEIFASHILGSKRNRKAAKLFSRESQHEGMTKRQTKRAVKAYLHAENEVTSPPSVLTPDELNQVADIKKDLAVEDENYLAKKRKENGEFKTTYKASLLVQAKSNWITGMNKKEKHTMYKEAGYSDDAIRKVTGKKLLLSAAIAQGLSFASIAGRGTAIANEKIIPFLDKLPPNYTIPAVAAAIGAYIGSYALFTETNLRLTKKIGTSASPTVTGIYYLTDKLVPNKVRDWASRGFPIGYATIYYGILTPLVTQAATAEPKKIIAASLITAGLNTLYAGGNAIALKIKEKLRRRKERKLTV